MSYDSGIRLLQASSRVGQTYAGALAFTGGGVVVGAGGVGFGTYKMARAGGEDPGSASGLAVFTSIMGAMLGSLGGCAAAYGASVAFRNAGTSRLLRSLRATEANLVSNIPTGLEDVANGTRGLIATNRDRLEGVSNNGYQNFPDFAEIGTIRTNEALINEVRATRGST